MRWTRSTDHVQLRIGWVKMDASDQIPRSEAFSVSKVRASPASRRDIARRRPSRGLALVAQRRMFGKPDHIARLALLDCHVMALAEPQPEIALEHDDHFVIEHCPFDRAAVEDGDTSRQWCGSCRGPTKRAIVAMPGGPPKGLRTWSCARLKWLMPGHRELFLWGNDEGKPIRLDAILARVSRPL